MNMTFNPLAVAPVAFGQPFPQKTFDEAATSYIAKGGEGKFLPRIMEYFRGVPIASIYPAHLTDMAIALYPAHSGATRNRQALATARNAMWAV